MDFVMFSEHPVQYIRGKSIHTVNHMPLPNEIIAVPDKGLVDDFWTDVELPHQTEDQEVQFVNGVTTAEWFAKGTTIISHLGGLAEILDEEIANYQVHLRRKDRDLARFKARLLSQNYTKVTKSANPIIQDAFIRHLVTEAPEEVQAEFERLEAAVEELTRLIEIRKPRRDQLYSRLKALKDSQESARQYLDYDKLDKRLQAMTQGGRL